MVRVGRFCRWSTKQSLDKDFSSKNTACHREEWDQKNTLHYFLPYIYWLAQHESFLSGSGSAKLSHLPNTSDLLLSDFFHFHKIKFKLKNTMEEIHCSIRPESRTTTERSGYKYENCPEVQRRWAWIRTLRLFYWFLLQILVQMKYESVWVDLVELDILFIYFKWGSYTQINQQMYFANY